MTLKSIIVIIDFDNYFGSDFNKITSEKIEFSFKEVVKLCEQKFTDYNSIHIRLYGGWFKETTLTKQASGVQQLLHNVNVFPKVTENKVVNGKIELATSLHIKPDFVWAHTHKETDGVKRIRLNHDSIDTVCKDNRNTCPKYILYKFTDSKNKKCSVNDCVNLQKHVFKGAEQKMVDTLIACDIISVCEDDNVLGLLVISDDQDHLPSLAVASMKKKQSIQSIILGIQNDKVIDFISNFMQPFNISITLLQ